MNQITKKSEADRGQETKWKIPIDMTNKPIEKSRLRFLTCGVRLYFSALVVLLATAGLLRAQSPSYTGVYVGQTSDSLGGFALFVDTNQNAVLIGGYLYNDDDGDPFYGSCTVDAGGNGHSDIANVTTSFTISPGGSVSFNGSADDGSYSNQMEGSLVASGPFLSVSGLYSIDLSGGQTLTAIVAPNGLIYRDSPSYGGGGRVQVTAYGQSATESSLGHMVSNFVLNQNATITLSGTMTLNRVDPLPVPAPVPMLGAAQMKMANGQFIFSASGLTQGSTNILQTCADPNLANWISIATNVANASTITLTNAVTASRQFYRVVQLP